MSPSRRIILNIIATYGRTLVGVACGIFSVRWVLMALGHEDFGLFGVVGSLAMFVTFLNTQFSGALSRFYAFSIGRAKVSDSPEIGLEECRYWFTTGVLIHTVLPVLLVSVGYPIGAYVISCGWLTIPPEKVGVCVWLWRFIMISSFVAMVNVPFQAMYTAKQYIAELTLYSLAQVLVKTAFIYYMTTVSRDWLMAYGLAMCVVAVVPQLLICARGFQIFPECRFRIAACRNIAKVKELATYAWWQTFDGVGYLARHQCLQVVVNKFYGPVVNAAYTVGSTVGGEASALTGALNAAFVPAITTIYGTGDYGGMQKMAYRACKFGTLLTLIFALPMALEIREVLNIWLKTPPVHAEVFCLCWLAIVVIEKFSLGHCHAIIASGRIAKFMCFRGLACMTAVPFAIIAALMFKSIVSFGISLVLTTLLVGASDVILARKRVGLMIHYWMREIIIPILVVAALAAFVGVMSVVAIPQGIGRLFLTTLLVEAVILSLSWIKVLDGDEREFVRHALVAVAAKFRQLWQ